MPKNGTVTNSANISLRETILKILVFTLAALRLNSKVSLFSFTLAVTDYIRSHKKLKIN